MVHLGQRLNLTGIPRIFTDFGSQGVSLFFLISGFLAGQTFFDKPNVNIKEYYAKRAVAILPLYYLIIIFYFISENIFNHFYNVIPQDELGLSWLRYVFILNGFLNSETYFWSNLGITWTIPIFCFFYLIAPFLLKKTKSISSVFTVWIITFLVTKLAGHFYECTIFSNIHVLFLGVTIFACVTKKKTLQAAIVFLGFAICFSIIENKDYLFVSLFSVLILISNAIDIVTLPSRLQNIVNVLDKYSYTFYLIHGVVFCSLIDRLNLFGTSRIIIAACAILISPSITLIVGRFIEKPIQIQLKKHLIK